MGNFEERKKSKKENLPIIITSFCIGLLLSIILIVSTHTWLIDSAFSDIFLIATPYMQHDHSIFGNIVT